MMGNKVELQINISQDCVLPLDYLISVNGKQGEKVVKSNLNTVTHKFNCSVGDQVIEICKENPWENLPLIQLFISFDLIFGNVGEAVNLPYAISYQRVIHIADNTIIEEMISKIVYSSESSLKVWKIGLFIQTVIVNIIVVLVSVIFLLIFNSYFRLIPVVVGLLCCWLISINVYKKAKKIIEWLNQIIARDKFCDK